MKVLLLCITLIFSVSAHAATPAKRPEVRGTSIPGTALCKDDQYACMYKCTMKEGYICQPTRGSDRNCPAQKVSGWSWNRKDLVVIQFDRRGMACQVTSQFKTNVWCENTKFGRECRIGPFRDMQ